MADPRSARTRRSCARRTTAAVRGGWTSSRANQGHQRWSIGPLDRVNRSRHFSGVVIPLERGRGRRRCTASSSSTSGARSTRGGCRGRAPPADPRSRARAGRATARPSRTPTASSPRSGWRSPGSAAAHSCARRPGVPASDGRTIRSARSSPRSLSRACGRGGRAARSSTTPRPPGAVRLERLVPDPALYPVDDYRRVIERVLRDEGDALLDYGDPRGHDGLRRVLVERLAHAGIETDPDDAGRDRRLHPGPRARRPRLLRSRRRRRRRVAHLSRPARHPRRRSGCAPCRCRSPRTALDLDALDATLARGGVRLICTMPTFQNPTGITTDLDHRRRLLAIAARHGMPRAGGRLPARPARATAARRRRCARSTPAARWSTSARSRRRCSRVRASAGWSRRRRWRAAATALKRAMDLASSPLAQAALARFCRTGAYDRHLRRVTRELTAAPRPCRDGARAPPAARLDLHAPRGRARRLGHPARRVDTLALLPGGQAARRRLRARHAVPPRRPPLVVAAARRRRRRARRRRARHPRAGRCRTRRAARAARAGRPAVERVAIHV